MKDYNKEGLRNQEANKPTMKATYPVSIEVRAELLALGIQAGLQVMAQQFQEDVRQLCGDRHERHAGRRALRWGVCSGAVVLGGRKIGVVRPRVRGLDGREAVVPSYRHYQDETLLTQRVMEQILAGVSGRKYARSLESGEFGAPGQGVSKSAVSRRFGVRAGRLLEAWLTRPLGDLKFLVVYLDGIGFAEHTVVAALGVDKDGGKHPLGIWDGSSENAEVCRNMLNNLIDRGLPVDEPILFVIDGSKALYKALVDRFGAEVVIQRCQYHKRKNVRAQVPKRIQWDVDRTLRQAYQSATGDQARRILRPLISRLETIAPGAAASLREGLDETLTVIDLGLPKLLRQSFATTNAIESAFSGVRGVTRQVKRWRNGRMVVRWMAVGFLEAAKHFHKVSGYKIMSMLAEALAKRKSGLDKNQVA